MPIFYIPIYGNPRTSCPFCQAWTLRCFGRAVGLWDSQEALRARARRRAQGSWVSESKMQHGSGHGAENGGDYIGLWGIYVYALVN